MASQNRLENVVKKLMDQGKIHPTQTYSELKDVYKNICKTQRVPTPILDRDGIEIRRQDGSLLWEPWDIARKWGDPEFEDGYIPIQERFLDLLNMVYSLYWGKYDYPRMKSSQDPQEAKSLIGREEENVKYPDIPGPPFSIEERIYAGEIGIHPSSLQDYYYLESLPEGEELWRVYKEITRDRSPESDYFFADLQLFVQMVKENGPDFVLRYRKAVTWSECAPYIKEGLNFREALAVHREFFRFPYKETSMLVMQHGIKKVKDLRIYMNFPEIFKFIISTEGAKEAFDAVGDPETLYKYRDRIPWGSSFNLYLDKNPRFRPYLMAGVSAKEIMDDLFGENSVVQLPKKIVMEEAFTSISKADPKTLLLRRWVFHIGLFIDDIMGLLRLRGDTESTYQVLLWISKKKNTSAFRKIHEWIDAEGVKQLTSCEGNMDEISPEYLTQGMKTSPNTVAAFLIEKAKMQQKERFDKSFFPIFPPMRISPDDPKSLKRALPLWRDHPHVHQVKTSINLSEEGSTMRHCVGRSGYQQECRYGRIYIFHVDDTSYGSTVAVSKSSDGNWEEIQHKGRFNSQPSPLCMERWNEFKKAAGIK